jgi:hypothetical protein
VLLLDPIKALSERAEEAVGVAAVFVITGIDHDKALRLTSGGE